MLDRITTPAENKQQELRMTIQRLRMKALMAATVSVPAPRAAMGGYADDSKVGEESALPPATHPRLKRRLRYGDDMCDCESDVELTMGGNDHDEEDEFAGPDGSFKLPRLMHPQLKRQQAVASIKHEHGLVVERMSPRLMLLTKPSRALPCFLSRAIDLRFVQ